MLRIRYNIIFISLFCMTACSALMPQKTITAEDSAAIKVAEEFILRHGFTDAGHPDDKPVVQIELFDMLSSSDELKKNRKGTFESKAFGFTVNNYSSYSVSFARKGHPPDLRCLEPVIVTNGVATRLRHGCVILRDQSGFVWIKPQTN